MPKNDVCLHKKNRTDWTPLLMTTECLTAYLEKKQFVRFLSSLYSGLTGNEVSTRQTVNYLYAQIAGTAMLLPYYNDWGWRACFLLIFCHTLKRAMCLHTTDNPPSQP